MQCSNCSPFDQLVGGGERPGGLKVDHELEILPPTDARVADYASSKSAIFVPQWDASTAYSFEMRNA